MKSNLLFQARVLPISDPDPTGSLDRIALFNPDGTPFTGGGGTVGPAGPEGPAGPAGPEGPAGPIGPNVKGFVNHGAEAATARPVDFTSIEWFGSVEPTNAIDGDTWINTT